MSEMKETCEWCDKEVESEDMRLGLDPYMEEVYGPEDADYINVCKDCWQERVEEV